MSKKIVALILAAMMALCMVSAFAEGTDSVLTDGKGTAGAANTGVEALNIYKYVVVNNDKANIEVAYPTMNFTFALSPATPIAGAYVNDGSNSVSVFEGVAGAVTIANTDNKVTIAQGAVTLNKNGQEIVGAPLTINVDPSLFTNPGVYRYQIKDNTPAANLTTPGVVRGTGVADRTYFLDVYIKMIDNGDGTEGTEGTPGTPGTPAVAGYVLTHENKEIIKTDTEKDSGFDEVTVITTEEVPGTPAIPGTDGTEGTPAVPATSTGKLDESKIAELAGNDFYYTYNATLTKTVSGSMGDKTHNFPFALSVGNNGLSYKLGREDAIDALTTDATETTLKDGEKVTIYGLSPYATVNYTETNDTPSTYKVSVLDGTDYANEVKTEVDTVANATQAAYNETQLVVTYAANAKATDANAKTVKFDNKLDDISPTGVVLRFAPYVAMLAAGIALVIIAMRRKNENED